jgi:hypothetical protein
LSQIDDEEAQAWRAKFREEFEDEDRKRALSVENRRVAADVRGTTRSKREREAELSAVRDEVRAEFYLERAYQLYTDSTGRELWLSPEEYEYRTTRRRKRKRRRRIEIVTPRRQTALYFVGMLAVAVLMGLALVHT